MYNAFSRQAWLLDRTSDIASSGRKKTATMVMMTKNTPVREQKEGFYHYRQYITVVKMNIVQALYLFCVGFRVKIDPKRRRRRCNIHWWPNFEKPLCCSFCPLFCIARGSASRTSMPTSSLQLISVHLEAPTPSWRVRKGKRGGTMLLLLLWIDVWCTRTYTAVLNELFANFWRTSGVHTIR